MKHLRFTVLSIILGLCVVLFAFGCTFTTRPELVPTIAITSTNVPTLTLIPTVAPSDTPAPIEQLPPTEAVDLEPTSTPLPPSITPSTTSTPGPFEHTLLEGETLIFVVQQYGHRSLAVLDEVVRINETIPNADILPGPGNVILIPRPTASIVETVTDEDGNVQAPSIAQQVENLLTGEHCVVEGDTWVGIAQQYRTTLEILSQLNSTFVFVGCDFNSPSGGLDCNPQPPLRIDQCVVVPAPTPTPTLSPTPSGLETATPTPTHIAPRIVYPPEGSIAQVGQLKLQWVSLKPLTSEEVYLIQINNTSSGNTYAGVTRSNSFVLPASIMPTGGELQNYQWTVTVARLNATERYETVSGNAPVHNFQWQSG